MKDNIVLATAILALVANVGTFLWVFMSIWGRVVRLDIERKLIWALISDDSKIDARKLQLIISQSADRLEPKIAQHFQSNGIGPRLQDFYRRHGLRGKADADAKWQLYVEFLHEWESQVARPLGVNVTLALELALQFCKEGDA